MALTKEQILYRQIDEILWNIWDPIGINDSQEARDEYQGYLPQAWHFKLQNADLETIAQYLYKMETDHMGLLGNLDNCRKVAGQILSL